MYLHTKFQVARTYHYGETVMNVLRVVCIHKGKIYRTLGIKTIIQVCRKNIFLGKSQNKVWKFLYRTDGIRNINL